MLVYLKKRFLRLPDTGGSEHDVTDSGILPDVR